MDIFQDTGGRWLLLFEVDDSGLLLQVLDAMRPLDEETREVVRLMRIALEEGRPFVYN